MMVSPAKGEEVPSNIGNGNGNGDDINNDHVVNESVELTISKNQVTTVVLVDQTTAATAATDKQKDDNDDDNDDDTDTGNAVGIGTASQSILEEYESILPPVTKEIREEYALQQKLKEEMNSNSDSSRSNKTRTADLKLCCCGNKKQIKIHICGVPALMWSLFILCGIGVIVYAVVTARAYDPSMEDDLVKPPYYSVSPTMAPPE